MRWRSMAGDPYEGKLTHFFIVSEFCRTKVEFVSHPAPIGKEVDFHPAPGEARELLEVRRKV